MPPLVSPDRTASENSLQQAYTLAEQYQLAITGRFTTHAPSSTSSLKLTGLDLVVFSPAEVQRVLEMVGYEKYVGQDGLQ